MAKLIARTKFGKYRDVSALSRKVRIILICLFVGSGLFDLITFLLNLEYKAFETNPLYLATGNVWLLVTLKVFVLTLLSVGLWRGPTLDWLQYALVFTAIAGVLLQSYAGYSNLVVAQSHPGPDQVLPREEAVKSYTNLVLVFELFPLIIATLAFKVHRWCNYEE